MKQPLNLRRPKDLDKYLIKEAANKQYLIFDIKSDTGYITKIDKTIKLSDYFDIEELAHNDEILCIELNTELVLKEKRYGRKNITEYGRILWFNRRGRTTYAQLDEYTIDYTGDKAEVSFWPSAQYKLNKDEQIGYKNHPDYGWKKMGKVKCPSPCMGIAYYWMEAKFAKAIMYKGSMNKLGTDLKYIGEYSDLNPYEVVSYFANFLKYQSIELLMKAGFNNIAWHKIDGEGSKSINWRATDLRKILKLDSGEIKDFKKTDMTIHDLERYHTCKKYIPGISFKETMLFKNLHVTYLEGELLELSQYLTNPAELLKMVKYLCRQNEKYSGTNKVSDYLDYLMDCEKLELDITNKKVLRPKNFQLEHVRLSAIVAENQDKADEKLFIKRQQKLCDMKEPYTFGKLLIRPAMSPTELTIESEYLHHCVRTYKNKVVEGRCAILFVRKITEPDVPFYTLEINKDGVMVQCRGKHNCSMTEEVRAFVEEWLSSRKKRKKAA